MASSISSLAPIITMLIVLVFLSSMAKSDFNMSPTPSPLFGNICDEVNCGRGNCSADISKPFGFTCKCDPGWRRTRADIDDDNDNDNDHDDDDDDHEFLPCVIPNCTLDYSCMPAPPPSPPKPNNISLFDPCYWTYCGEGTCNKNNTYKHTCDCKPGYTNLMNISHFPCFSSCAIGSDCSRLGVRLLDASSPNGSPSGDSNQGIRFLPGGFHWVGMIVMSIAMAMWN
ncbi:hypothetical protein HanPSC8_Chr11g0454821 [Helianthus annuus]|nr:hypothetical protein HanIR_Chr11g0508141 [Helianthus annuus]KAJ0507609.1 hypothetical protein HanIR_Chr11g0508151 [Helianthus annuus]KAJ0629698.1 hypothetical protein HanIR_Chr00c06g0905611 [Helianthus annuus]KAJ0873640.1 hypothetical protein HanPSC8_Chr11g0454821 [Helianthus annuus]